MNKHNANVIVLLHKETSSAKMALDVSSGRISQIAHYIISTCSKMEHVEIPVTTYA